MEHRRLSDRLPFVAFLLIPILCNPPSQASETAEASRAPDALSAGAAACTEEDRYTENFETGWASDWYLASGFQIVSSGSGKVLQGTGASSAIAASLLGRGASRAFAAYLRGDYWTDLSFSFDLQLNAGEFWASLRYNPDIDEDYAFDRILSKAAERYYVTFTSTSVVLGRTKAGTNSSLRSAAKSLTPGRWYAVKLVAEGPLISVYVDDVLVLSATDTDPVPSGSIEFETKTRAQALLDNVQVVAQVPCEYTWTRTKTFPVGGDINVIAVDPKDANVVYAGTEHMGLWKSTDAGQTWSEVGYSGDMGRLGKITAIVIAPSNTKVVYAAWVEEVDRSTDAGAHWTRTDLLDAGVRINGLAVSPDKADIVYAALGEPQSPATQGVFKSSDGGESWTQLGFSSAAFAVAVAASSPDTMYLGSNDGVYKSTDGGGTWTKVYTGARSGDVSGGVPSVAVDPSDANTVYAVADGTVKSTNGGSTWTKVRSSGAQVVVSPSDPKVLYLRDGPTIFKSVNRGETWTSAPSWAVTASSLTTIAVDSLSSDRVYAGTWGQGVFYSKDSGATWSKPTSALIPSDLGTALALDPRDSSKVYVGTSKGEVYVSRDKGATWTRLVNLGTGGALKSLVTAVIVDTLDSTIIYASNVEGVWKSKDAGANWTAITSGLTDTRIISLALDPKKPTNVFAGTGDSKPRNISEGTGLFYSANGGDSWSKAQGLPDAPIPAIVISPSETNIMYAAAMGSGVYKSVNSGTSWSQVNSGLKDLCLYALAIDPKDPNVAYAGTSSSYCKTKSGKPDHVYKTTNGGVSWDVVLEGKNKLDFVEAIAVDPSNPLNVYVAYHTEKVWLSSDAGKTWRRADKGVIRHGGHLYLWAIGSDSTGSTFYMTTCGVGVLRNDVKAAETFGLRHR